MSKQTEALNLALEALEYISSHYMSLPKIGCMALAAVEEALAEQPAQQELTEKELSDGLAMALHDAVLIRLGGNDEATMQACARIDKLVDKYRAEKPEIKPAQQDSTCNKKLREQGKAYPRTCKKCGLGPCIADRVQPAQQQEPVCNKDPQGCWSVRCQLGKVCKNKYPPASKPWVGLTEEDRLDIWKKSSSIDGAINATASKLREKNA